jgi:hypothetical protein
MIARVTGFINVGDTTKPFHQQEGLVVLFPMLTISGRAVEPG